MSFPAWPYEHRSQPLLSRAAFLRRFFWHFVVSSSVIGFSLAIGVVGYHVTEGQPWLDALVSASMILTGMGPTGALATTAGKWFASLYALFSGVVFLATAGLLVVPVAHRVLHRLHLESTDANGGT
jgi:hypothetical protein